jgi:L-ascorbate metabolism protein UlaG (beta-lactamase superfamily)
VTGSVSVTWWGHATATIEVAGRRILTDPVLTGRVAHLSRVAGPLPTPTALQADVAVVSHLHHDHLHVPSLRLLPPTVRIVGPVGTASVLTRSAPELARRVEEVAVGDVVEVGDVRVLVVAALHDGRRSPMSRHQGPALGFVAESDEHSSRVWFAGDTGLFPAMADIGPVDVAVLPVGGWGSTLGPTHLDPVDAAEAVRRVGARDAVPVHYGTFWATGLRRVRPASFQQHFADAGARFATELLTLCPHATAHVIAHGVTATIPGGES